MICSGLEDNLSVTHLDLSHNKIADWGVRAISKLLQQRRVMAFLDLADNQIHSEGGRSPARTQRDRWRAGGAAGPAGGVRRAAGGPAAAGRGR